MRPSIPDLQTLKEFHALDWRAWAARALHLLPRENLSRNIGWLADRSLPPHVLRPVVQAYAQILEVDLDEADAPPGGYPTFNDFFTRRLRPEARPLDPDPSAVLCPADGRLEEVTRVESGALVRIKGRRYRVSDLVGSEFEGHKYVGGYAFLVYLSPRDYHRVHAPVGGVVTRMRYVPGTLYPVNRIGEHVHQLFARNERVTVVQESERFGAVSTVLIGAFGVGRIGLAFDDTVRQRILRGEEAVPRERRYRKDVDAALLERGDELGVFYMGSSVMVFVPGEQDLVTVKKAGDSLRYGEALARRGGRA